MIALTPPSPRHCPTTTLSLSLSLIHTHCLTSQEFRAALANMHFAVQDADLLFSSYGADQVGELRYDGFCKLLLQRKPMRGTIKFSGSNAW